MDRLTRQVTIAGMVASTSYVLFSNMSSQQMGVIPLLNNRYNSFNASTEQKIKGWNAYFPTAMKWALGPAIANAAFAFTHFYFQPHKTIRYLALASGVLSISVMPLTLLLGLPTINSKMLELGQRNREGKITAAEYKDKTKEVDGMVRDWEQGHKKRFGNFVGAWGTAMAVLVLSL